GTTFATGSLCTASRRPATSARWSPSSPPTVPRTSPVPPSTSMAAGRCTRVSDCLMLPPGAGRLIAGGGRQATLKVPGGHAASPGGLAALLREAKGRPDPAAVAELRRRYDIEQLTALRNPAPVTG